ncbi:hypothetical protein BH23GEM9_BH23GEM9_16460 [soil metagenome]
MHRLEPRYPCPACLGVSMAKLSIDGEDDSTFVLDHCRRCGGLWLQAGEVQRLRGCGPTVLSQYIASDRTAVVSICHSCHVPLARDASACAACGADNTLDCPECLRPMAAETHDGVRLDVCRHCRAVWFDRHELETIWRFELAAATERRLTAGGNAAEEGSVTVLEVLVWSPDLLGAGVYGAANLGQAAAVAAGQAPEAAAAAVEVAAEAAGGVFEAVLGIIGGIFS